MFSIAIGIGAVVLYLALLYLVVIRNERRDRRDARARGLSLVGGPTREPVSFKRPAAKGFRGPGNGEAA